MLLAGEVGGGGKRGLNRILLCRPRNIEGVTGIAGAARLGREGWFFAGSLGHHMARFAQDPLNGLAGAMGALHLHGVARFHDDVFKNITALKASKLKNGHTQRSKNTHFHDKNVKL
jgi:hypothetical protein